MNDSRSGSPSAEGGRIERGIGASLVGAFETLGREVRHAARSLLRRPLLASVAVGTLAIGTGATTAVFSVVDGVLLKPLPYPEPESLVGVWHEAPGAPGLAAVSGALRPSPSMYFTYAEHNETFEHIGIWNEGTLNVTGLAEPEEVSTAFVSDGTLQALGVPPLKGRWLSAEDQAPGGPPRVMLSHGYWQSRFGGADDVVGRTITLSSQSAEIVGVMPRGFRIVGADPGLIAPMRIDRSELSLPPFCCDGVARFRDGVTIAEANADMTRMLRIWIDSWPFQGDPSGYLDTWQITPAVQPLKQDVIGNVGNVLWVVMGTIGIVLLIACANVTNLLLVRADARRHELAVRSALGAGAWKLGRSMLVESVLLGLLGGGLGLVLAFGGVETVTAWAPAGLPRVDEIALDSRAFAFALLVSLAAGLVLGVVPTVKHAAPRVLAGLRAGQRGASASRDRQRAQSTLVVTQVALALVLLVGSGLMLRTFEALRAVEPGITAPGELQTMRIAIPPSLEPEPERVTRTQNAILDAIETLPGVESAGFASSVPLDGAYTDWDGIEVEGRARELGQESRTMRTFKYVSPGYLQTVGTRLVAGRDMTWTEVYESRPVVLVSANLAREIWDEPAAALGQRIRSVPGTPWREIVGVVEDVRESGLHEPAPAIVYWPSMVENRYLNEDRVQRALTIVVRSSLAGTPALARQLEQAVWSVSPSLPVADMRTMQDVYDDSLARTSFTLLMLAIAAATALVLGVVGLYGALAYAVSQRTREMAIRLAVGAPDRALRRRFVLRGVTLAGIGVVLGLGVAAAAARLMRTLLYEVEPVDAPTYAAVSLVLIAAAALASYVPARRASTVDPARVLAAE